MTSYLPGVLLLTGASSGIGKGAAITFAEEGCTKLFLGDVNESGLQVARDEVLSLFPSTVVFTHKVDIADEHSVQKFIDACVARFGRIDYAANVAGVVPQRLPIHEVDVETYDRIIGVNEYGVSDSIKARVHAGYSIWALQMCTDLHQTWLCHRAEIRQMMKQLPLAESDGVRGSIVSVSSLAGINASSGMSTYCASKHAIVGFAKTDAQDYGPHGIRVNVVAPGMIDTELFRKTTPKEAVPQLPLITPLRRLGRPSDIGRAMAFLLSGKASFISGVVVPVDGGLALQRGVI